MTNYDVYISKSFEEAARYIQEKDEELGNRICKENEPCPFGDDVEPENCLDCIKKWLSEEADKPTNCRKYSHSNGRTMGIKE